MHEDITVTNKIYGGLPNETLEARISGLTAPNSLTSIIDVDAFADAIVERLRSGEDPDNVIENGGLEKTEGTFQ